MVKNLNLILIVLFRTIALSAMLVSLLWLLVVAVLNVHRLAFTSMQVAPMLVPGILLWLVAKRLANVITSGLDER